MKMVRKTLIPAAVGLLVSPALMAADIDGPSASRAYSQELLNTADATDTIAGDALGVALGAEYAVDDVITLSFSGDALDDSTLPNSITVAAVGTANEKGITLGLLSSSSGEAVYRVTALDGPASDTTVGVTIPVAIADVLDFNAQAVQAAGGVTVSFAAETNAGLPLDTGGGALRSIDYLTVDDQFSVTITDLDGVIDVETGREAFVGGTTDVLTVAITDGGSGFNGAATLVDVDWEVEGDFSWIFDTDAVTAGVQPATGVLAVSTGCTVDSVASDTVSGTCTTGAGSNTLTVDVGPNVGPMGEAAVLAPTSFTATVTVNYSSTLGASPGSTVLAAGESAGSWTLNGAQVLVPYMPYGPSISQIMYLANRGTQTGDVTVDVIDQFGATTSLGVVASIGPGTTLSIAPLVRAALPQSLRSNGRLALTVTVNLPADDMQLYTAYNVNGSDRGFVQSEDVRFRNLLIPSP